VIVLGTSGWTRAAKAVRQTLLENPAIEDVRIESDPARATDTIAGLAESGTSLVFVTRGGADGVDATVLRRASGIMIEGIDEPGGSRILGSLVESRSFDVVDRRPDHAGGSVVLRRMPAGTLRPAGSLRKEPAR
jgi:hypothetical protein